MSKPFSITFKQTIMNPIKFWQIIKDDKKKTFEAWNQAANTNSFTNKVYAMQKAGMYVSSFTPPVTQKNASKDYIAITGYTREDGLYERLAVEYRRLVMKEAAENFDMDEPE